MRVHPRERELQEEAPLRQQCHAFESQFDGCAGAFHQRGAGHGCARQPLDVPRRQAFGEDHAGARGRGARGGGGGGGVVLVRVVVRGHGREERHVRRKVRADGAPMLGDVVLWLRLRLGKRAGPPRVAHGCPVEVRRPFQHADEDQRHVVKHRHDRKPSHHLQQRPRGDRRGRGALLHPHGGALKALGEPQALEHVVTFGVVGVAVHEDHQVRHQAHQAEPLLRRHEHPAVQLVQHEVQEPAQHAVRAFDASKRLPQGHQRVVVRFFGVVVAEKRLDLCELRRPETRADKGLLEAVEVGLEVGADVLRAVEDEHRVQRPERGDLQPHRRRHAVTAHLQRGQAHHRLHEGVRGRGHVRHELLDACEFRREHLDLHGFGAAAWLLLGDGQRQGPRPIHHVREVPALRGQRVQPRGQLALAVARHRAERRQGRHVTVGGVA